jgi:prefoldin alpha subunit
MDAAAPEFSQTQLAAAAALMRGAEGSREAQLDALRGLEAEYEAAMDVLEWLPRKLRHELMVPLGPLCFAPGFLQHTNEVLVLLGDNVFAERTAAQAREVLARRLEIVRASANAAEGDRRALSEAREASARVLGEKNEEGEDVVDIREAEAEAEAEAEEEEKENEEEEEEEEEEAVDRKALEDARFDRFWAAMAASEEPKPRVQTPADIFEVVRERVAASAAPPPPPPSPPRAVGDVVERDPAAAPPPLAAAAPPRPLSRFRQQRAAPPDA